MTFANTGAISDVGFPKPSLRPVSYKVSLS